MNLPTLQEATNKKIEELSREIVWRFNTHAKPEQVNAVKFDAACKLAFANSTLGRKSRADAATAARNFINSK